MSLILFHSISFVAQEIACDADLMQRGSAPPAAQWEACEYGGAKVITGADVAQRLRVSQVKEK